MNEAMCRARLRAMEAYAERKAACKIALAEGDCAVTTGSPALMARATRKIRALMPELEEM